MNVQIMGGGMSVQYPVNMEIAGRVCVIIGGGRVAERKAHVLLQAGAHLIVIAPALTRLLYQEASTGCFFWLAQRRVAVVIAAAVSRLRDDVPPQGYGP